MEEGEAEDPTREWIAFYAMAVEEGTPSSSYPKTCHIWHNLHRRMTSCGADSLWPMTCSLSTRGSTTFLDYCPEFWVQVNVEVSLEATKPARQGVVGYMCRSCGGDKWPVAAAAASWSACQSKSSCCHVRYKRCGWLDGWTVGQCSLCHSRICICATFLFLPSSLACCVVRSVVWFNLVISKCQQTQIETRHVGLHVRGGIGTATVVLRSTRGIV